MCDELDMIKEIIVQETSSTPINLLSEIKIFKGLSALFMKILFMLHFNLKQIEKETG